MRRLLAPLALGLAALASAQYPGSPPPPDDLAKGFGSIRVSEARAILGYLAGPECQGRGTGQPGFQKAAEFVAARFRAAGLKPLGEKGTYFQYEDFYRPRIETATLSLGDKRVGGSDLALAPTGRPLDLSASVVIVRGDATGRLTDEQASLLDGKIVLASLPAGRSPLRSQIARADTKAVLNVVDRPRVVVPTASLDPDADGSRLVRGEIARAALPSEAASFLAGAGGASVLALPDPARLAATERVERVRVPNVVGMIEGSDPTLRAEVVGVGGHLDHLGINAQGVVYPGADDDGSGSTAVMLIAKAVATNPVKPKRSVVFMTFFGEEMGLLGSRFLTEHPPVPLDKMVAELQMDMVGRDSDGAQNGDPNRVDRREENVDTIRLVGSKRIATDLDRDIQEENRYVGFRFKYDAEDVYTRSDHYNFAAKGVPIAFLFDGFHPDYHQPTDTIDKIDWAKLTNAAKLYYLTLMKVANDPAAPRKDVPQGG